METLKPPGIEEADYDVDTGYFFRRLGEIALGKSSLLDSGIQSGIGSRLVVANRLGVIIFCDATGEPIC